MFGVIRLMKGNNMEYIALHRWMEVFHRGTLENIQQDIGDSSIEDFTFYELGNKVEVEQKLVIKE